VPIVSVQNQYNIAHRGADDVVDYCSSNSIGFIPWFPLASGKLSRPGGPLDRVASELGRHRLPGVPGLAPPPFTGHAPHPRDVVGRAPRGELRGRGLTLSDAQFEELTDARKPLRRWALTVAG
jgi:hypothetical protein